MTYRSPRTQDIAERLREWSKDMRMFGNADQDLREAADEIERLRTAHAYLSAAQHDRGEPVAWRCIADDGVSDVTEIEGVADQWRSDGFAVTPLYAAPRQAVPDHQEGE